MALRRVGNQFMDEEEYEVHAIGTWAFFLFVIGAVLTGYHIQDIVPQDWPQWGRFAATILPSVIIGGILGSLSIFIRFAFFIAAFWGGLGLVLYWVWMNI